jgi:hypothetical protein
LKRAWPNKIRLVLLIGCCLKLWLSPDYKNKSPKSLDAPEKPYYCGSKKTSSGAVSPRLCPAPHRIPSFRAAENQLIESARTENPFRTQGCIVSQPPYAVDCYAKKLIDRIQPVSLRPPTGLRSERMIAQRAEVRLVRPSKIGSSLTTEHHDITGHRPGLRGTYGA